MDGLPHEPTGLGSKSERQRSVARFSEQAQSEEPMASWSLRAKLPLSGSLSQWPHRSHVENSFCPFVC